MPEAGIAEIVEDRRDPEALQRAAKPSGCASKTRRGGGWRPVREVGRSPSSSDWPSSSSSSHRGACQEFHPNPV